MSTQTIKPQLKVFDLSMIVMSLVIGMGIFSTPAEVAGKAGRADVFFWVWMVGAAVSLLGALTFAEIGSRLPHAGGFYKLFSVCYTPVFAFMVNWITVLSNAASTAAVSIMGAAYVAPLLLPNMELQTATLCVSSGTVVMLLIINLLGIKVSALLLNGLMLVKLGLLCLLIACVFACSEPENLPVHSVLSNSESPWKAFLMCFIPVFFTFGGYQQTINFGSDIANPSQTIPRSIFIGMGLVIVLYLLVNYSYIKVLGLEPLAQSKTLAADMIYPWFGKTASVFLSLIMFCAVTAYVNVSVLSNPRVYYAMAEDRVLPKIFARVNSRTQVQEFGLMVFCGFILITLFAITSFEKILQYVMFFDSISLITAAAAIFILRRQARNNAFTQTKGFKIPLYPYLPIAYIAIYALVIASVFLTNTTAFGWGAVLFILGYPLYYGIRKLITLIKA